MSDTTTKAAGEKATTGKPTPQEIKAAFDRLSTLLTCGSRYCVHDIPPDIAVGLTMMQEALGWVLGHPDSAEGMDKVLALLKARQSAEEVLNYDVAGGPVQEQTDAIMKALGRTRRQPTDPLTAMLQAMLPPGAQVVPMSGALEEALLATLGLTGGRRRGGKTDGVNPEKNPPGENQPGDKTGGAH